MSEGNMFKPGFAKALQLAVRCQLLLRGVLLLHRRLVLQIVHAARIPGGLTPP